jgi:2-polyprenyl-6-methoxyphenol hydroxylase-like FAD-dependent oxidoreductase
MTNRPPGRVAVVGGGAAGAFFTLELSRLCPDVAIDLYDRDGRPPGAGIVLSWAFADRLKGDHPEAFALPESALATWDRTLTVVDGERVWSGAYGMFGVSRRDFNEHLRRLVAARPNVRLTRRTVTAPPDGHDLVVLADGANSRLREASPDRFGTHVSLGRTRYLWMSTPIALEPTFVLQPVRDGLLIVHSYPHASGESTFIVEADAETLARHGLLDPPMREIEERLARTFAAELEGAPLRAQTPGWRSFRTVVNDRWHDDRMVLVGDAAHTVHFSTGSGTALAIDDALCLARALAGRPTVAAAVEEYTGTRRPVIEQAQAEAGESRHWFETLSRRERLAGHRTVFALRSRRTANTYARLRARDPEFVGEAVRVLAGRRVTAEPVDVPLTIGALTLRHRVLDVDGARGAPTLCLPTTAGPARCLVADAEDPPATGSSVPECVLVEEGPSADVGALVRVLRSAGARAVGLLVSAAEEDYRKDPGAWGFDFVAVPSQSGSGRVERTRLADEIRYRSGLPVLLLSSEEMSRDELNTLVLAGRIDMYARAAVTEISRRAGR